MLWGSWDAKGGLTVVQQEFNNRETCEVARQAMVGAHNGSTRVLGFHGCFKK